MSARKQILPVFIPHLGCPYTCVFCNQHEITGAAATKAMQELNMICHQPPKKEPRELAFYGGSFTALPAEQQLRYLEKAEEAMNSGVVSSVRLSTRPDAVSSEILDRLKRYHVRTIELGAQSMQDSVLQASGRGHSASDVVASSRLIREAGFQLVLQMMTGLPGDTKEGTVDTANRIIALKPDAVRIYPTVIVRGTELERRWRAGSYQEHTIEDAVQICAEIVPMFDAAGIPVIRLGLNPTDDLTSGAAIAGAYHPALGELVRSRMLRNQAEAQMREWKCAGKTVIITVPEKQLSQMIGQKRCNIEWLKKAFSLSDLIVKAEPDCNNLYINVKKEKGL